VTGYEEWRVSGRWAGTGLDIVCHFTSEADARAWLAERADLRWSDGPHLHKRTVTFTEWETL
jgi:hypothetical protein